jgi:flavin reductase (DIM6/NTAB) family NADH-FMN oxidoreductase RutF
MHPDFFSIDPCPLLSPVPAVLVSCAGREGNPNLITLAWAGTVCSDPPMVSVSIRKSRYSHDLIESTGEFVINLVDQNLVKAADYCGVKSGRDMDKFAACRLHAIPAPPLTYAPAVQEAPAYMCCRVEKILPLGSHDMFLANIVGVAARNEYKDEKGSLRLDQAGLVAYNHGVYQVLGDVLGFFGYSVAGEKVLKNRMAAYRTKPKKR